MRRYIVLLLITGIVWTQTDYDKLVLKDGEEYLGEYLITNLEMVYFKTQNEVAPLMRHKREVQTLQLKDGTFVINNRPRSELTIEEKAVYYTKKDAQRDAKKWLAYPTFALLSSGGLATTTFFIGEDIVDYDNLLILIPAMVVSGSLGLVGSYNLFSKLDKKNIESTSAEDSELYRDTYSKEFKKGKFKNIIIGALSIPVIGVAIFVLAGGSGGGYTNSPQPPGPW